MAKLAEQFEDAHGPKPNFRREGGSSSPRKPSGQTEVSSYKRRLSGNGGQNKPKCFVCGKLGHVARNCFKRQQAGAMVQTRPRVDRPQQTWNRNQFRRPYTSADTSREEQASSRGAEEETKVNITCRAHGKTTCVQNTLVKLCGEQMSN